MEKDTTLVAQTRVLLPDVWQVGTRKSKEANSIKKKTSFQLISEHIESFSFKTIKGASCDPQT